MYYYKKPYYKKKYGKYYRREYKYHYIQQAKSLRNIQRKRRKAQIKKFTNYLKKKYYGSKLHHFFVKRKVKRFLSKQNNLKPSLIDRIRRIKINMKNIKILKRG